MTSTQNICIRLASTPRSLRSAGVGLPIILWVKTKESEAGINSQKAMDGLTVSVFKSANRYKRLHF